MANFTAGTSFTDGVTNDVTAAKLNALVADAVPTSNLSLNSTTGTIATFNSTTGTIPTLVATTLITTGAGSAAAPAIVPTGDTNTGIFFPAADTIAFSEGGAEAMRIDSSGQVGIGISPSQKLDVNGASAIRSTLFLGDGSSSVIRKLTASTPLTISNSGGTPEMTIDASGNVGIGTTSLYSGTGITSLNIYGTSYPVIDLKSGSNTSRTRIYFDGTNSIVNSLSGALTFQTGSTEALRIDSSGNVGIGSTSPNARLFASVGTSPNMAQLLVGYLSGSDNYYDANTHYFRDGASAEKMRINSSGNVSIGTATALSKLHVHGDLTLSNATTAVTAATGGVSKPATYTGFLTVSINGTSRKIPYYS